MTRRHPAEVHLLTLLGVSLLLVTASCQPPPSGDPAAQMTMHQAPPGAGDKLRHYSEGELYAYLTTEGNVFVLRRDLNRYAWVTHAEFKRFLARSASKDEWLVYDLEDGDLVHPANRAAFMLIRESGIRTHRTVLDVPEVVHATREGRP